MESHEHIRHFEENDTEFISNIIPLNNIQIIDQVNDNPLLI